MAGGKWTTPSLDRLATQGMVLKRCYSAAPICGPAARALLTGKYTIHTGVRRNDQDLPDEEVTIAEALKGRGYTSAVIGKWQSGKPRPGQQDAVFPLRQGFEEFFGYTDPSMLRTSFPSSSGKAPIAFRLPATSTTSSPIAESTSSIVTGALRSSCTWPMSPLTLPLTRRRRKSPFTRES